MQDIFAGRKARVFNERFRRGDAVLHRLTPGGAAQWDRVYSAAFVHNGESVVELAGRAGVVPTDRLFAAPPDSCPPALGDWASRRGRALRYALAAVLGGALVVLLALSTEPARSAPARVIYDCDSAPAEPPMTEPMTQGTPA